MALEASRQLPERQVHARRSIPTIGILKVESASSLTGQMVDITAKLHQGVEMNGAGLASDGRWSVQSDDPTGPSVKSAYLAGARPDVALCRCLYGGLAFEERRRVNRPPRAVRIPVATKIRHPQSLSKLVLQTLLPRQTEACVIPAV